MVYFHTLNLIIGGQYMDIRSIIQTIITGLSSGMVSYMMVAGMSLIISGMNMVNFGQGAFFVLGTFLTYTITAEIGFFPAIIIVPIVVGLLGWFVEKACRPLFGKNMLYIMLLTFGVAYIVSDAMVYIWGHRIRLMRLPDILTGNISVLGANLPIYYIFMILIGLAVSLGFYVMFNKTKLGIQMKAIINDREMVSCLGINVDALFSIMFMIGIGVAALGGVINAPVTGMSPKEGLTIFGNIMPILMIGGMRNMNGCLPAALMVGLINAFGAIFFPQFYNLIPAVLMVVSMLIRPQGIFTKREAV